MRELQEYRDQFEAVSAQVAAPGAPLLRQGGGRTAYSADPEDNVWEVARNPTAEFE